MALLLLAILVGCGGGGSHKTAANAVLPAPTTADPTSAVPTPELTAAPTSTPVPVRSAPVTAVPTTAAAAPTTAPAPATGPSAADLASMRTSAISRCQSLIVDAPAAGPCQYIRTIVPATDTHFVYVEVAASGHDGTVFHQALSAGYAPVLDSGDQPPQCSAVTAAGIPLRVWSDIVRQIQGGSGGEACYS